MYFICNLSMRCRVKTIEWGKVYHPLVTKRFLCVKDKITILDKARFSVSPL